ncbi:MAG TPA: serine hydrolase domain-containing protein [Gemmatimonadales bacterium]
MLLALAALALQAAPTDSAEAWLRREMATRNIPGLAVAVIQGGKLVLERGLGLASVELQVPVTPATRFQIASTTKIVTATAIMQLVESGKLGLDQPVGSLLDSLPEPWRAVTPRRLLSHTSGLPDFIADPNTGALIAATTDSAMALVRRLPMAFPTGTQWQYNQTNYFLLGELIRRLTGLAYPDYFAERFFRSLGMTTAVLGDSRAVVPGRATSYTKFEMTPAGPKPLDSLRTMNYVYPQPLMMAAGLNLSAGQLATFGEAVRSGRLLRPATRDTMWTAVSLQDGTVPRLGGTLGFGLGWMVDDDPSGKLVGMEGGAAAALLVVPGKELVVAVLTNLQGAGPTELARGVAQFFPPARATSR